MMKSRVRSHGEKRAFSSVKAAYHSPHSRLCQPEINVCTLYAYSYPELRHLRQETSDTVVTPSIPDMTLGSCRT